MEASAELRSLQDERERLELEKLRLEVSQFQAPWWKKPPYLAVLVPVVISTVTLLSVWSTGWFDKTRNQLIKEKGELKAEVDDLKAQEHRLNVAVEKAKKSEGRILQENLRLSKKQRNLTAQLDGLINEVSVLRRERDDLQLAEAGLNLAIEQVRKKEDRPFSIVNPRDPIHRLESQYGWKLSSDNRFSELGYYLVIERADVNSGKRVLVSRPFELENLKKKSSDWREYIDLIQEPLLVLDYTYLGLLADEQAPVGGTLYRKGGQIDRFHAPLGEWSAKLKSIIKN